MRPIDADALKATISQYEFNAPNERYKQGGECVLNFYMPKIIDDAPTIEAEPVRHGKWERPTKSKIARYCSLCGTRHVSGSANNFCPKCGAKMEGGIPDETVHDKK